MIPFLLLILLPAGTPALFAQTPTLPETSRAVQPAVLLVFGPVEAAAVQAVREARELLETTVEGELRSSLRYDLTRVRSELDPETYTRRPAAVGAADAVVFARTVARTDGSLRVELDLWRSDSFIWSVESRLPVGRERFEVVADLASELESRLSRSFPGFGRLAFNNTGVAQPYYVYANDALLGVGLRAIELPVGTYNLEIRRVDEGFEHVVGRRSIRLADDDYLEVRFRMDREAPPVPGFLRLTDPADRWNALFDLRGAVMIPREGFSGYEGTGVGFFATALFNDVLFRGHVFGFETGYVYFEPDSAIDDLELELEITSLMASTGISVGPVSRVDYIARVSGGMALTASEVSVGFDENSVFSENGTGYAPAFAGSMEFGFGFGRSARFSVNIGYLGVHEDGDLFSFIALGVGLGGRF
jgi:hypothetical protein